MKLKALLFSLMKKKNFDDPDSFTYYWYEVKRSPKSIFNFLEMDPSLSGLQFPSLDSSEMTVADEKKTL